jgi:hypothetical protein
MGVGESLSRALTDGAEAPFKANAMAHRLHLVEKESLVRANTAMLLTLVWGGLAVCALGAVIFDLGKIFAIW